MCFVLVQDVLYSSVVLLLVFFSSWELAESKPTMLSNTASPPNVDVTQQRKILDQPMADALSWMSRDPEYEIEAVAAAQTHGEKRVRRDKTSNPCVTGHRLVFIDDKPPIVAVTCAEGCKEIKRLFFVDREDPLVIPVDCKTKS